MTAGSTRRAAEAEWSDRDVRNFYLGPGRKMAEASLRTPEVAAYLMAEEALFEAALSGKRHLIEIGSGIGRYRRLAAQRGLHYDGIDLALYSVELRSPAPRGAPRSRLHAGGAETVVELLAEDGPAIAAAGLVIFPFNCLGNLSRLDAAIAALRELGAPVLASVFRAEPGATEARLAYYRRCGFADLAAHRDPALGTQIVSSDGLRSWAYRPGHLVDRFAAAGFVLDPPVPLGEVGLGLLARPGRAPG